MASFVSNVSFPVVSSNINFNEAVHLKKANVKPYHIFPKYRLAVIGYITNSTRESSIGAKHITFYNPVDVVQHYVDELHAMGVKRIVCVSHNGYEHDKYLAAK